MSRVFLMKWYHFSVEHFEDLRNVNHCEFLIMRRNDDNGKYILENNLRTWSELKRERAQELAEEDPEDARDGKDGKEHAKSKDVSTLDRAATVEVRRRWGGCPNGCDHDKSFKIHQTLADLVKSDSIISNHAVGLAVSESESSSGSTSTAVPNGNGAVAGSTCGITNPSFNGTANSHTLVSRRPAAKRFQSQTADEAGDAPEFTVTGPQIDVTKARDEVVSSPDGTPSFISVDDRLRSRLKSPNMPPRPLERAHLHVGRDFGGTYSGHNSAGSDDSHSEDDSDHHHPNTTLTPSSSSTTTSSPATNGTSTTAALSSSNPAPPPPPQQQKALGIPPSAIPHHHRPHKHLHREQSRMGRGTRANRLGDHHSSDGEEHEADCEHDERDEHDDEHSANKACEADEEESGSELVTREMVDEADEVLAREEREDRSLRGSVY
jgi:hypothetical protein